MVAYLFLFFFFLKMASHYVGLQLVILLLEPQVAEIAGACHCAQLKEKTNF